MTSLWDKFDVLNVQRPAGTRRITPVLRNLLRGPSIPKGQGISDVSKAQNEDLVDGNSKCLKIDVVNKNKVIIKYHKPKEDVGRHYQITKTTRKRKADESKIIRRTTTCADCGYSVFETDFAISCRTCERTVHKRCWDAVFDKLYMSERLKWTTSNKRREPDRPKSCANCLESKTGDPMPQNNKNLKIIMYAGTPPKRRKYQHCEIPYSLRTRSKEGVMDELTAAQNEKPKDTAEYLNTAKARKHRNIANKDSKNDAPTTNSFNEYVSWLISKAMDGLGHSIDMIKHRQRMYAENDICGRRFESEPDERITTGGRAEGTTMYYESDIDYMFVVKDIVCAENLSIFENSKHMTFLQIDSKGCSPGYTRLKLMKLAGHYYRKVITRSVVEMEDGEEYLSNVRFIEAVVLQEQEYKTRDGYVTNPPSGPSTPLTHRYDSFDDVIALRCYCPSLIGQWMSRPRRSNWPNNEVIQTVAQLEAHAVPVGFKGSLNQAFEWRICYSLAELHLMKCLNECQIQMYIILKNLAKECLQSICRDITSYVMKNITLWVCEGHPITDFHKGSLLDRTIGALIFLKKCLENSNLPSYMIKQRNLLAGRIDKDQICKLSIFLDKLIKEKACLFLRIKKVHDALFVMYREPITLKEYADKRDRLERLVLLRSWIREEVWVPGMSRSNKFKKAGQHVAYLPLERDMEVILSFDEASLKENGVTMVEIDHLWVQMIQKMLS